MLGKIKNIEEDFNYKIQPVAKMDGKGTFQLAVYNSHNGYYGHGIVVAKDNKILLNETL